MLHQLFLKQLHFSGCGAATTAIEKRNLEVQTKNGESIFLEPVAPEKQIVCKS